MRNLNLVIMAVALIGTVLAFVRLTQRGESRRWIMAGVAVILAVALVLNITRRNRTTEVEIPAEMMQSLMRNSSTTSRDEKSPSLSGAARAEKKLPSLEEVLKEIDSHIVSIPGGTFIMGSPDSEVGHRREEGPQHEVTLSAFEMSKYEVTRAQWLVISKLPKVKIELYGFTNEDSPLINANWNEAAEFCARLSKAAGKTYRLPTEAEWEYAARATTSGPYAGNLDEMAWYDANSEGLTHPVGTKQPNAFGLYDMHGNAWEWCSDWFSETYYAQSPSENPTGPATGSARVYRGGGYGASAPYSRSAYRGYTSPGNPYLIDIGLRLVRTSK